jgi:hypothetical protein
VVLGFLLKWVSHNLRVRPYSYICQESNDAVILSILKPRVTSGKIMGGCNGG